MDIELMFLKAVIALSILFFLVGLFACLKNIFDLLHDREAYEASFAIHGQKAPSLLWNIKGFFGFAGVALLADIIALASHFLFFS